MRITRMQRALRPAGFLVCAVALVLVTNCSTDSPTAPLQDPANPVRDDAPIFVDFETDVDGLTVIFTNLSTGATRYRWDFGDRKTSAEENPVHTYSREDVYTVTLTAGNGTFEESVTQFVGVGEDIEGGVTLDAAFTCIQLPKTKTIQFERISFGADDADKFLWDFGDGAKSSQEEPRHPYAKIGNYLVELTVSTRGVSQSNSELISVVPKSEANGVAGGCIGVPVPLPE